jgi:hypothetical protein
VVDARPQSHRVLKVFEGHHLDIAILLVKPTPHCSREQACILVALDAVRIPAPRLSCLLHEAVAGEDDPRFREIQSFYGAATQWSVWKSR